jgi:anthranilate synthase component 2
MDVLLIDNYDSFTYNLVQLLEEAGAVVAVMKNDAINREVYRKARRVVLSPGPGLPEEAGLLMACIGEGYQFQSILGICLGHQALGMFFGARLGQLPVVEHGVETKGNICGQHDIFDGLPPSVAVGHYHSWVLTHLPESLEITMTDPAGNVMAFKHRHYNISGLQFHPESIMTPCGSVMVNNWLRKT